MLTFQTGSKSELFVISMLYWPISNNLRRNGIPWTLELSTLEMRDELSLNILGKFYHL